MRRNLLGVVEGRSGIEQSGRGESGPRGPHPRMWSRRLHGLQRVNLLGRELAVAETRVSRLLGLALLDRAEAGEGLLIPRCHAVHTFGMRFPLDLIFLDRAARVIRLRRGIPRRRFAVCAGADAVIELPTR